MLNKSSFSSSPTPGQQRGPRRQPRSPDAVGSGEHIVVGNQGAAAGMSPLAVLEVLERDLEQGAGEPCISPGTAPLHPLQPASHPCSGVLTCQGQLWGLALSPPTTRADRLGWKVGAPQPEAGVPRRGNAQVREAAIPSREGAGGKSTDFGVGRTQVRVLLHGFGEPV